MEHLPIFINLKDQYCLVVGGGDDAFSKITLLLKAGARVKVLASILSPAVNKLKENNIIMHQSKPFSAEEVEGCKLIFAATDDEELGKRISKLARERNIPINVVDFPELCTFTMPAIIDRSPLLVAVSTGGNSPTLARIMRSRLEALFPQSYGRLAQMVGSFREIVKHSKNNRQERRKFWNNIFASPVIEMFLSGKEDEAGLALQKELEISSNTKVKQGQVCLVGAGPGDTDLLTLRALRLIQNADTIVYDRLVFPTILEYARRDAQLIYVGKKSDKHTVPQEQINQKLIHLANQGKMVVRLKGGDPFIFGRGGEEIEMLIKAGVSFQVVPGVTAASGCSSYAGIPLTHRDYAQSCILVTGHQKDDNQDLNWGLLARPKQTIVFYMGLKNIRFICRKLIEHNMSPVMPAAIIQKGTTLQQKVFIGTVSELPEVVNKNFVKPPAIIIVGEVVKLHQKFRGKHLTRIF